MTDLEQLKQLSLHDMSVNSLTIHFEHRQLIICLAVYNEETRSYNELRLDFQGIDNLRLDAMALDANGFDDLEIYTHTVTEIDKGSAVQFQLLTGHGQRGATWSFSFRHVGLATY